MFRTDFDTVVKMVDRSTKKFESSTKKFDRLQFVPVPTVVPKDVDGETNFDENDKTQKIKNRGILSRMFNLVRQSDEEPLCKSLNENRFPKFTLKTKKSLTYLLNLNNSERI